MFVRGVRTHSFGDVAAKYVALHDGGGRTRTVYGGEGEAGALR